MRVLRLSLKYVATLGVYVTYEKIKKYLLMWVEYPTVPPLAKINRSSNMNTTIRLSELTTGETITLCVLSVIVLWYAIRAWEA